MENLMVSSKAEVISLPVWKYRFALDGNLLHAGFYSLEKCLNSDALDRYNIYPNNG